MTPAILIIAVSAFRLTAAATKTKVDDAIAEALSSTVAVLLSRPQIDAWAVAHALLAAAKFYADQTARTGDDKLLAEFQAVAAALEQVIGTPVLAAQLQDVLVPWDYLDAPGQPRSA